MSEEIEVLRQKAKEAESAWRRATQEWHDAMCRAHPVQPGDILVNAERKEKAIVTSLYVQWGKVRPKAMLYKKTGEVGNREASMWRDGWVRESP